MLAVAGWAQSPAPPSFPGSTALVVVDAVVLEHGQPVGDLGQGDFTLFEDGVAQAITTFERSEAGVPTAPAPSEMATLVPRVSSNQSSSPDGRVFVIVLDELHLTALQAQRARVAVRGFLDKGLHAGDRVMLVPTSGGPWWSGTLPQGRASLHDALALLRGRKRSSEGAAGISDWEALRIAGYRDEEVMSRVLRRMVDSDAMPDTSAETHRASGDMVTERFGDKSGVTASIEAMRDRNVAPGKTLVQARAEEVWRDARARENQTLEVLRRVMESLAAAGGRKSVLLVSEGFVHDPREPRFREVTAAAARANAVLYSLDARVFAPPAQGSVDVARLGDYRDVMAALGTDQLDVTGADNVALDTGGFTFKNSNNLQGGLEQVAAESRVYYLLGYVPRNREQDGTFRKIELKTARPGVEVRARKGYYAPKL